MDHGPSPTLILCLPAPQCLIVATKQGTTNSFFSIVNALVETNGTVFVPPPRLAGFIRHHLANESGIRTTPERYTNGGCNVKTSTPQQHPSPTSNNQQDQEPMDYRCYSQPKIERQIEVIISKKIIA
jgi:hypothetical protein